MNAGTAQEIPIYAKIIILIICLIAVVLTAAWGKVMELLKGANKKKSPAVKEAEHTTK
jgi:hypothetical protein